MAASVSARVSALDAYLCREVGEGLQGDVMALNYCGIIRICLGRREGYLSTISKLKGFKVTRVVSQKINVAYGIVCSSSPNWSVSGWPGWLVSVVEGGCIVGC